MDTMTAQVISDANRPSMEVFPAAPWNAPVPLVPLVPLPPLTKVEGAGVGAAVTEDLEDEADAAADADDDEAAGDFEVVLALVPLFWTKK